MKTLSEIIEDVKLNKRPDYEDLRYSLLVMTGVLNMVNHELVELYVKGIMPNEFIRKLKLDGICKMYGTALNKPPKEYLGWNGDPENPEYQRFYAMASKLMDKTLKGELPNPKEAHYEQHISKTE
jgi:hypothetical protein